MQRREHTHVLMFDIVTIKEVLIACVHHEHGCNGDYNCGADTSDFTLNSGGGHLYILALWSLPS
jgi:hypothetical protein